MCASVQHFYKIDQTLRRYGYLTVFKTAKVRHHNGVKFIFNGEDG